MEFLGRYKNVREREIALSHQRIDTCPWMSNKINQLNVSIFKNAIVYETQSYTVMYIVAVHINIIQYNGRLFMIASRNLCMSILAAVVAGFYVFSHFLFLKCS